MTTVLAVIALLIVIGLVAGALETNRC